MPTYEEVHDLFRKNEQEHVLADWDRLSQDQREELLDDCASVDFAWLKKRRDELAAATASPPALGNIEPAPVVAVPGDDAARAEWDAARALGEEKLRQGKVAAFVVAGGQGTRLGFKGPKGCYPVGPLSGRTLFRWHAERILARSIRHGAAIPWYIMTSADNDRDTRAFFEENGYFGLRESNVFFFRQEMVPCLDFNGKLMLASPSRLAMNPSGHGGSLSGLRRSGALEDMKSRGVEIISYFQIDNPLVSVCDPVFVGWHVRSGSEMSCKVLEKNSPAERIGIVCLRDGKAAVVEYIDLDEKTMRATGPDGRLIHWAGSIAIHMLNVDFVDRVAERNALPWHRSRKKVLHFVGNRLIKPERENAIKFETFVFDALPYAKKTLNLEVIRECEFAPLKNAEGADSVETCRQLISNHFRDWLARCGVSTPVPGATGDAGRPVVEISPLYSLDAEELATKVKPEGVRLERALLLG